MQAAPALLEITGRTLERGLSDMARTKRKINHLTPPGLPETKQQEQRIYNAGAYARLSVEDSGKPGADTIESQKALILDYIESQPDMELCGIYCDNGQTGVNFERPGFETLMDDVRAGKIDCVVVKDLSRFGRNYRETGNYLERIFPFMDVRFVALSDSFDTLTAERSADGYIVPLKNIINEMYSKDISRKSGSALATKQRRGEFIGSWAAYGYQKCADDRHRIEPDGETAPVVKEIFQMRSGGMGYRKIAMELNRRGIPAPSRYHYLKGDTKCARYAGVLWQVNVVKQILSNKVYLGHMVQGRKRESFYEGKKQRMLPESEWTVVYNTHEPLVDEGIFSTVQEMAAGQKEEYRERLGKYDALGHTPGILKKLVYCADCGRGLTRYKSVTCKGTKKTYFYVCRTHAEDPDACPKKYMPEERLLEILWDTLEVQIRQAAGISGMVDQICASEAHADKNAELDREAAAAGKELKRAQALYDGLYPMYAVDRALTEHEYMQMRQEYRVQMQRAEKRLEAAEQKKKEHAARMEKNPWLEACAPFHAETGITEEMAHALISRVEVSADNSVAVRLRWRDEYRALVELLEAEGAEV